MKRGILVSLGAVCIVGGAALFLYSHLGLVPVLEPHGIIALQERTVIYLTFALCAIVVIPVFILLFMFAWMYHASSPNAKKEHTPNWDHDSVWAEFIWWLVPSVIIVFLSILAWQTTHKLDPYRPIDGNNSALTIDVVALDWKWLFLYPDQHIATINMVEFPENTPIHFEITADAPMNSFWIPSLGGQIMAMPGMSNQLYLQAKGTGTYNGLSGNISGKGFAGMTFTANSVSTADFNTWVQNAQQGTVLDATTYAALAAPSEYVAPKLYSLPDPSLYTSIIMKYMSPSSSRPSPENTLSPMQAMPSMNTSSSS